MSLSISHAPLDYECPFCAVAEGHEGPAVVTTQAEIVYQDEKTLAFVCANGFGAHPGHILVVPREHYENVYELPDDVGGAIFSTVRRVAIALRRSCGCKGLSMRQHNEPVGHQDVWHYHVHVFPRFPGDSLNVESRRRLPLEDRLCVAERVRKAMQDA